MAAQIDQAGAVTFQITNPHGDVIGTTNAGPNLIGVINTDEYGLPRTATNLTRYQYVGKHQRWTDTATNIVLMGQRLYNPATGRFGSAASLVDSGY